MKVLSPWAVYAHQIDAFFKKDDDVTVVYDNDIPKVSLYVRDERKANALMRLLSPTKNFGNIDLKIIVIPANKLTSNVDLFADALEGNEAFSRIVTVEDAFMSNPINYVLFEKEVVQYPTDDLGDANGLRSTLYQDMAKELFGEHNGIFFCTEKE